MPHQDYRYNLSITEEKHMAISTDVEAALDTIRIQP